MTDEEIHNIYLHMSGKAEGLVEATGTADFPVMFARAILEYEGLTKDAQNMASKSTYKEQLETKDEPVCRLQEPTVERAWFTIAELNAWADKKLSENPHWVMPKDEPERDEPPPQRTWVGLTDEEKAQFVVAYYPSNWDRKTAVSLMSDYEKYLKEKNHV